MEEGEDDAGITKLKDGKRYSCTGQNEKGEKEEGCQP